MNKLKIVFLIPVLAGVLSLSSLQVCFGQSLLNGNFTSFSTAPGSVDGSGINITGGMSSSGTTYTTGATLNDWANSGYAFIFETANDLGATAVTGSGGSFNLWDTSNGGNGTLAAPPGGGNILAMDGAYEVGPLTQAITGLTSGRVYNVTFEWAGAQQEGASYTSITTDSWSVALGAATGVFTHPNGVSTSGSLIGGQTTSTLTNPKKGFTGWHTSAFSFTANASSETLYFFANGVPVGQPPFALLSDVVMTEIPVPEASASSVFVLLFGMLLMVGNWARRRFQKNTSASA